jgi:NitT/TauT family transport system substrate-binding protein
MWLRQMSFITGTALAALLATPALAQEQKPVRLLMNWFAQPDQSGFWQAQIDDAGKDKGLKIITTQGGPKIQTIPQVAAGQAEFGVSNADDVLLARLRGAPVRAVFVSMDYVPYSLVYHPNPEIKSITDLKQKTFAVSLGFAYWEWLKKQYGLQGAKEIPVSGDLGLFRNDRNMVQQGYSLYLPARMSAAGIANAQFKVADLGYRPYAVLFTTDDLIAKNPGLVRDTVAAVQASWANFMKDPAKALAAEQALNNQVAPEIAELAAKDLIAELLPRDPTKIGCMTDARWDEITRQLQEVKFLPAEFDVKKAYDKSWVPGC